MKYRSIVCALAALSGAAAAQTVSGGLQASRDTDDLRETIATAAYRGTQGFGLKAASLHYNAPGWRETGALLAATYLRDDAALQIEASLGVAQLGDHEHAVGSLNVMRPVASGSAIGLSLERDYVNSVAGIDQGITFGNIALVADHAFHKRFNVGLAAGTTLFSNDNRRPFVRTRWSFEVEPAYGLNAYLKTRSYQNSEPNRPAYFSPERLNEVSVGLSSRFVAAEQVVLGAAADIGTQHTESGSQRIWSYALSVASLRGAGVQWRVALEASNAAGVSQVSAAESYRYTRALAQVTLPF